MGITLACPGCGFEADGLAVPPFRCPNADRADDLDHVFVRRLDPGVLPAARALRAAFLDDEPHPFVRYRQLLQSYRAAVGGGLADADWEEIVRGLDRRVAAVDGAGFAVTPFAPRRRLTAAAGVDGELWVKDETGNVSGSHKARHLLGVLLWLEVGRRLAGTEEGTETRSLAIASCGNAALAAAVLARAAGRRLEIFIPADAEPDVVARLARLGPRMTVCRRQRAKTGDPTVDRFRAEVDSGRALPFSCQGQENGLILEGGMTLGWEMVSELLCAGVELDHLFVQVGGGALARATIAAFVEAHQLGLIARLPRIYAVQTAGASPLIRAYDRVVARILHGDLQSSRESRAERAERVLGAAAGSVAEALEYAGRHRASFMWPWEEEPRSIAGGILDDETYDWLGVVGGMLASGGYPVVVSEALLCEANGIGVESTGIPVSPTGSAGLAGCLELRRCGELPRSGKTAVLFTGVRRPRP